MNDYIKAIILLIRQLNDLLDTRPSSSASEEDSLVPGPIEDEWPDLYAAVQDLEKCLRSPLPMVAWGPWNELLSLCRESGDEAKRGRDAYVAANKLLIWAKTEHDDFPSMLTGL